MDGRVLKKHLGSAALGAVALRAQRLAVVSVREDGGVDPIARVALARASLGRTWLADEGRGEADAQVLLRCGHGCCS